MTHTALIVGGGIAGPLSAIALREAGIDSVIYEAYEKTADGVGAFLTLAVNALDALRVLDLDGVVRKLGFDTPRISIISGSGKTLGELPYGGARADGSASQTMRRADLYAALREEAIRRGVRIEYGKRLIDAEKTESGVLARFADGTTAEGDLLIGADGLRSRTREIIDPQAPSARYVGLLNIGGYAKNVKFDLEPGVMNSIFGRSCFFACMQSPTGEVWWVANPARPVEPTAEELAAISTERWRGELMEMFAGDRGPALEVVKATDEFFAGWNTYDFPSVPKWHNGRMVIIGDAAHATSPSSGQGAAMAIEDTVVLAKCLRDNGDIAAALTKYESLRRERVEAVVELGKKNGDWKAAGPLARIVRDPIMRVMLKRAARGGNESLRWLYENKIEWNEPSKV
ncbi:FAD-dependent oxidoreductase [Amycolatopsis sp. NPDC059657]|uniref:FAD-dependent oxidoreductase n=1 Tax=Amycolatopsis sp. NPDC059657 TaxID=3346899 RepID=UPI003670AA47